MDLTEIINTVFGSWAGVVLAVIGLFSAVATVLPQPSPTSGTLYRVLYRVMSWLACNVGKARNADETPPVRIQAGKWDG